MSDIYDQIREVGAYASKSFDKMVEDFNKQINEAYQRGLKDGQNETWEYARKIVVDPDHGGITLYILGEIFGTQLFSHIMQDNTAQEAIDKIKAYEEKQKTDDDIKVKDEVEVYGSRGVVTYVCNNLYTVMMSDGSCGDWEKADLKKTGKQHDIDKILKEMKE